MTFLEDVKKTAERVTGWHRPAAGQLGVLVRKPEIATFRFRDDGLVPNHPRWPLIILSRAVRLPRALDPAAVFEAIFEKNGWGGIWRGEIYDYLHYHSRTHEVLGIARGSARVRFGGNRGRTFKVSAGDVVVLPAGTGHQALSLSKTFKAVGAYPPSGAYDECAPTPQYYERARQRIRNVPRPKTDPLFGAQGPLFKSWRLYR